MIYERVKELAVERKVPITVLEERVGLGRGTIGKWRTQYPNVKSLFKVAKELDVTLDDLLTDLEEDSNEKSC